jgi:spore coat protein A, manganese oxidase
MKINRRKFLKISALAGGASLLPMPLRWLGSGEAQAFAQSPGIPLFGTKLRGVGPGGIPVALPSPFPAPVTGVTHYDILIDQFQDPGVCPTLGPTTLWGYNPTIGLGNYITPTHLGGIIIGQKNVPIQISFYNLLFVNKHILPVDTTIPGANQAVNRTAIHLHGGLVPWISDGGPFDWWTTCGDHGLSFLNNQVLNPKPLPTVAEYYYPLKQSARFLWYHDHAYGITRLNAYAGLASALILRDTYEAGLIPKGLPNYIEAGGNEIPLVFQDKIFVGPDIKTKDPLWSSLVQPCATRPGSLWYAHTYEANNPTTGAGRWDLGAGGLPLPDASSIPEFFGDTMLVNGTVFPEAAVQARRYRLRMLNACNARFLNLQLYVDDGTLNGITLGANGSPTNAVFINAATQSPDFLQIGTEGGFLAKPVKVASNQPFVFTTPPDATTGQVAPWQIKKSLVVACAERPDLIVDFANYAGKSLILYNDAPAPYPSGDDRNDYFPGWNVGTGLFGVGNPVNGTTKNGFGPNTRVLMRFKVAAATSPADLPLQITTSTNLTAGNDPLFVAAGVKTPPAGIKTRFLSLNEYFDAYGRLIQVLGNADAPYGSPLDGSATYLNYAPTGLPQSVGSTEETVKNGDVEIWEVFNNTGDVHPMHFHLVNVQLINRQLFDVANLNFSNFLGAPVAPEKNEQGWKETIPMYPGTVTRCMMKFDLTNTQITTATGKVIVTPPSPRTGGMEYVWHCHILEHEEHDMMHSLVVK